MGEWVLDQLGNYLDFRNGKTSPERHEQARFPVFGSNGVIGYSEETNAPAETIVIGRVGTYCGSLHFSKQPCWITDNAIICSPPKGEARYWFYSLQSAHLNNYRAGSGQPLLNQGILKQIKQYVPAASERASIGEMLGAIDDKIELNRRTNETLEAMARALFRDWFVDFGPTRAKMEGRAPYLAPDLWALFPARLDDETGLPEGWQSPRFEDLVEAKQGKYVAKSEMFDEKTNQYPFPVWGGNGIRGYTQNKMYDEPVVWITCRGSNCGLIGFTETPSCISNNAFGCSAKIGSNYAIYICFLNESFSDTVTGSAQPQITYTYIRHKQMSFAMIGQAWEFFSEYISSYFTSTLQNNRESQTLATTRDFLLPKLISGEIRLRDAEKLAEEAAA